MPTVEVHVFAMLRKYTDGAASVALEIAPGETVGQLVDRLGVPAGEIRILFVDGRAAGLDHSLDGGETIAVFPGIAGG